MQLESAYHTNKKKHTADEAFRDDDYDYLYRIVSTGIFQIKLFLHLKMVIYF